MRKRILAGAALALSVLVLSSCDVAPASHVSSSVYEKDTPSIIVLHTNDVRGGFSSVDPFTGDASDWIVGQDVVAGLRDEFAAKNEGPVFLLDGGDAVQGVYFVTESRGESAIDVMNAAGYDAMVLGNHEFDYGWQRLTQLAGMAKFPLLSQLDDAEAAKVENLRPYTVVERGGVRLGVFGLTSPETSFKSDGGFGRNFGNEDSIVAHAKEVVKTLREQEKVDYVVCLSHLGVQDMGYGSVYAVRDEVTGIDLIIDGSSHIELTDIDNPTGKTPITSAGGDGGGVGVSKLSKTGEKTEVETFSYTKDGLLGVAPNKDVAAVIETWNKTVAEAGGQVVAQIPFDVSVVREEVRTGETVMGNITTDAMRAVSGADIALQNGGNIRDQQLAAGDVTKAQMITIFPYGNIIQMAEVPGAVIKECLELAVSQYPEAEGSFMQVSGMAYGFKADAPAGQRITWVTVGGQPLNPETGYTVCTNDFIASGGDQYTMLIKPFSVQLPLAKQEYQAVEDAVIWYLAQNQQTISSRLEGRIVVE